MAGNGMKTSDAAQATGWYRDAVFYELPVGSFFDASGDGIGDFRGLIRKLDYISDLGATCIWLLPYFPSPQRDNGYDITDYRAIHANYGTIEDFREFVSEAHRRGLKIAAEMVINHTSNEHPWFEAARSAPPGSALRDFYVWSDTADRYMEAEVLPLDGKRSHWTWDSSANAFYWHRFTRFQPDLNYDNPLVRSEMLKVLRFWAELGVDGLCLNGASYLMEREGTKCVHLQETHAVLKEFRQQLVRHYPDLMIQAGLNAWPSDAAGYFGEDDECHMVPHMPLALRMFLAIRQEDRSPLADIIRQTPVTPDGCQWVTLLRNHDELTLATASDEERDYLFREYAVESSMKYNCGILRRLGPLAENSRRRIELLFGLLFALPGAPMIYYGDEIGMGDNVFAGGRNGLRTPMQWNSDRNAGFSHVDFARLFAAPVMDPLFGYQAANVDAQQRDSSSLLHWLRRIIALRKHCPVLSRGTLELLEPENSKVMAFVRTLPSDSNSGNGKPADDSNSPVLVVANLSRQAQPVQVNLAQYAGLVPVEMFGRTPFPAIDGSPYPITLGPHGFYWFQLKREVTRVTRLADVKTEEVTRLPAIPWNGDLDDLFEGNVSRELQASVLPGFLKSQRWFGGKARALKSVKLADWGSIENAPGAFHILLDVEFAAGTRSTYYFPMSVMQGPAALAAMESMRSSVVARLEDQQELTILVDAIADDAFCASLLALMENNGKCATRAGTIRAESTEAFARLRFANNTTMKIVRGPATSSNSLLFFGRRLLLKLFRRLEAGTNPDFELGRFLSVEQRFRRTPPMAGKIEYKGKQAHAAHTLAILQGLVANQGDGWGHALDALSRYYERASARMFSPDPVIPDQRPVIELAAAAPSPEALETVASYLGAAATLGRRTAEMHLALASKADAPEFAPEPLTIRDLDMLRAEALRYGEQAFSVLRNHFHQLPSEISSQAEKLLEEGAGAMERLTSSWNSVPAATKLRIHGDYHLGQVLWVDSDYVILDFEGEPMRSLDERRAKDSPARDVAGMLRSYHYAAYAGLFSFTQDRPEDFHRLEPWADLWQQWVSASFLAEYLKVARGGSFLPQDPQEFANLLDGFTVARALYEMVYELNNRPDWVRIPLSGVLRVLRLEDSGQKQHA